MRLIRQAYFSSVTPLRKSPCFVFPSPWSRWNTLFSNLNPGPFFQKTDCRAHVIVPPSLGDGGLQHLFRDRGQRQGQPLSLGRVERQTNVLVQPLRRKVGGEISRQDGRRFGRDQSALSSAVV